MKSQIEIAKANRRRYYIKQKLKDALNVNTHKREVELTPGIIDLLPKNKKRWLNELGERFGYNLQYSIT